MQGARYLFRRFIQPLVTRYGSVSVAVMEKSVGGMETLVTLSSVRGKQIAARVVGITHFVLCEFDSISVASTRGAANGGYYHRRVFCLLLW